MFLSRPQADKELNNLPHPPSTFSSLSFRSAASHFSHTDDMKIITQQHDDGDRAQLTFVSRSEGEECSRLLITSIIMSTNEKQQRLKDNQIFIRNLAYTVTAEDLERVFSTFGPLKNATVAGQNEETGAAAANKGFGFVKL